MGSGMSKFLSNLGPQPQTTTMTFNDASSLVTNVIQSTTQSCITSDVGGNSIIVDGNYNVTTISTSGEVSVQPFASNFGLTIEMWADVNDASKLTIGSNSLIATAAHDVEINSISTISGPIEIYGNNISLAPGELGLGWRLVFLVLGGLLTSVGIRAVRSKVLADAEGLRCRDG